MGHKIKANATGKTSKKGFGNICKLFMAPETLMTDGGPEFDNEELREECNKWGTKLQICPAYLPWVNGLLEGTNGILLNQLKRMCAPDLEEDKYAEKDIPSNWPDHLEATVRCINNRIVPNLKYSPNKLLLGMIVNTKPAALDSTTSAPMPEEINIQMAYTDDQRFDGYTQIVDHAHR